MVIPSKIRLAVLASKRPLRLSLRTLHFVSRIGSDSLDNKEKQRFGAWRANACSYKSYSHDHDYSSSSLLLLPRACHWQTVSLVVIILEERLVFLASWIVEIYKPN